MSTKKALLPTPARSPERGPQTLISAPPSDPLAQAIDVPAPMAAAVTIAPAINLRVVFIVCSCWGFLVVEVVRQQVRIARRSGSRATAVNVAWCPKSPVPADNIVAVETPVGECSPNSCRAGRRWQRQGGAGDAGPASGSRPR